MQNNPVFYKLIENKRLGDMGISVEIHRSTNPEMEMNNSMHWHNYNEFELVLSGKGDHTVNGYESKLSRGVAYYLSYNDFHELKYNEKDNSEALVIINANFDDTFIDPLIYTQLKNLGGNPVCYFTLDECVELEKELMFIKSEIDNPKEFSKEMIRFSFNRVLIMYLRKYRTEEKQNIKAIHSPKIQKAVYFIHNNFSRNISLMDVAEYVGCSPNYISGLLKTEMGSSFGKYLKEIRLRYAHSLLNDGNTTVSGVAKLSGFDSVSYFIENYKKYYGETPGNSRANNDEKEG